MTMAIAVPPADRLPLLRALLKDLCARLLDGADSEELCWMAESLRRACEDLPGGWRPGPLVWRETMRGARDRLTIPYREIGLDELIYLRITDPYGCVIDIPIVGIRRAAHRPDEGRLSYVRPEDLPPLRCHLSGERRRRAARMLRSWLRLLALSPGRLAALHPRAAPRDGEIPGAGGGPRAAIPPLPERDGPADDAGGRRFVYCGRTVWFGRSEGRLFRLLAWAWGYFQSGIATVADYPDADLEPQTWRSYVSQINAKLLRDLTPSGWPWRLSYRHADGVVAWERAKSVVRDGPAP
ncbi:MAG TPA: hypothetical protein VIL46_09575 [Gemmataceae bacterium]